MYEHRRQPLVPRRAFLARLAKHFAAGAALIAAALFAGMAGYHFLEGLPWLDAYLNAAMILGGMGPVATMHSDAAKIFAGSYALFSGLIFIGSAAVLVAPWLHRLLHRLHAEPEPEDES